MTLTPALPQGERGEMTSPLTPDPSPTRGEGRNDQGLMTNDKGLMTNDK